MRQMRQRPNIQYIGTPTRPVGLRCPTSCSPGKIAGVAASPKGCHEVSASYNFRVGALWKQPYCIATAFTEPKMSAQLPAPTRTCSESYFNSIDFSFSAGFNVGRVWPKPGRLCRG